MKKSEISLLNMVFCLLVVFIHICSEPVTRLTHGTIPHMFIYALWKLSAFVVQGFVFLSGMKLFLSGKQKPYLPYIKSRFVKIILPYMLAVFVYYLYFVTIGYFGFSIGDLAGYIIKGDLSAQFYFVVVITQFYLLRSLWGKWIAKIPAIWGIIISALVTVMGIFTFGETLWYNDRIFTTYLIYWIIGCYVGANYDRFREILDKGKALVVLGFLAVAVVEVVYKYYNILPYRVSEAVHIAYCLLAIFTCYILSVKLSERLSGLKIIKAIDGASYYIYLWHILVLFIITNVVDAFAITDIGTRFIIRGCGTYFVTILLCHLYIRLKEKIRG